MAKLLFLAVKVLSAKFFHFKNICRGHVLKLLKWDKSFLPHPPSLLVSKFTLHYNCFFNLNFYQSFDSKFVCEGFFFFLTAILFTEIS